MSMTSIFKRLRSRTSDSNNTRRLSKEDQIYHAESNPTYLKVLLAASGRPRQPIKTSSIPIDSWGYADQEVWLFRTLVEVCNRPDYNAYDIVKNWSTEHELEDLYDLDTEEWSKVLGSWKDAKTVHRILRKSEKKKSSSSFWRKNSSIPEPKFQHMYRRESSSLQKVGQLYHHYEAGHISSA
ncbi:hypothetical protein EAF04_005369 [Stromatinia cepivora]|nr:hypothetical protein EAF04_005369 [Stromatinia cepivora]